MSFVAGIDPGVTGALAFWRPEARVLEVEDMPIITVRKGRVNRTLIDEHALVEILRPRSEWLDHVYLESVHAMPGQGVVSMFGFGMSYGIVRGILAACEIPCTLLDPARWVKLAGVARGPDASRQRALQLFPEHRAFFSRKKDNGRADAALLAHLCGAI